MALVPPFNKYEVREDGRQWKWHQCTCGWKTRKRRMNAKWKYVLFDAFHCPKCGRECSGHTLIV